MQIRRAGIKDAAILSKLASQTFYDTFTGTCTDEDMRSFLQQYFSEDALLQELQNENDYCFFIEEDNVPLGYIRFMEDYTSFPYMNQWKALELKRIYILKEHHGKGIAQKLMAFIFEYATQNDFKVVWLGVWEHNYRAQKFYEKYGFINSGHTHDFPIGNTPQTDIWMWKFLD